MTRIGKLAVVSAFLLAGTAFGQAPTAPQGPPADGAWRPDTNSWQSAPPAAAPQAPPAGGVGSPDGASWPPPSVIPDAAPHPNPTPRIWGNVDYFLGWVKGDPLPVLATTSPAGTPQMAAGVLGQTTTSTTNLFGGDRVNNQVRSGIRAGLGGYLDDAGQYAIEAGFFGMESQSTNFLATSNGSTILARPFINATNLAPVAALVAFPGLSSGSIHAEDTARNLFGYNLDVRESFYSSSWVRCDALLGYQWLRYDEHLQIQQSLTPAASTPFTAGTNIVTTDNFGSRNIFNGVDLGFRNEFFFNPFSLEVYGKVAVGVLNRTTNIFGNQVTTVPGSPTATTGSGLLALSSNIGTHSGHTDEGVPEFGLTLGWDITDNIRFRVGYSVMWWVNLVRPGNEIDVGVNPGLITGGTLAAGTPNRPALTGDYSDLWVQAINFSLEIRY